ncbi:DUF1648 domain-containing protein [Streptomyces sp. AV19]|uniref:DUF1648 domain-containing protein n=1 Tax=Streptomyces sp. AV19 TaxID=2793068 RepID=UPI0018FEBC90|nr:DUF1648 domain-containing protein [Streptomyces sp. AV19]MBH1933014.1 DUF1648 domain-containing protein [Streptomyces sp. AV19]MDG4531727.1 DUF1648 domain-containing protein [Streptomyces sp. AV19]
MHSTGSTDRTDESETSPARIAGLTVVPFAAGLAVTVVAYFVLRDDLPSRMPTHFGTGGADGYSPPGQAMAGNLVLYAVETVLFLVKSLTDEEQRSTRPTLIAAWAVSVATTYFMWSMLMAAADAGDGGDVSVPAYQYVVALAAGGAVALGGWLRSRKADRA